MRVYDTRAVMKTAVRGGADVTATMSETETDSEGPMGLECKQRQLAARWKMLLQSWRGRCFCDGSTSAAGPGVAAAAAATSEQRGMCSTAGWPVFKMQL